jgi:hypothetical protein
MYALLLKRARDNEGDSIRAVSSVVEKTNCQRRCKSEWGISDYQSTLWYFNVEPIGAGYVSRFWEQIVSNHVFENVSQRIEERAIPGRRFNDRPERLANDFPNRCYVTIS